MTDPVSCPTLLHRFLHWEAVQPDRIYLTQPYPDGRVVDYTWREVGDQARRMAAYFQSLRMPPGSNIALLGKNSAHWIIADLAIMMAGHISVPMYPTLSSASALYVLELSEVRLLVLGKLDGNGDNWSEIRKALPVDLPLLGLPMSPRLPNAPQWDEILSQYAPLDPVYQPQRDELCTIVFTSGTSGLPKGVMHTYGSMTAAGDVEGGMFGFNRDDRGVSFLPLAHLAERILVESLSLYFGYRLFFCGDLSTFKHDLQRARPTFFLSVPRLWTKFQLAVNEKLPPARQKLLFSIPLVSGLLKRKLLRELGLDSVRVAITGSAPLAAATLGWYRQLGLQLLEGYGMSENFGISHITRPNDVRVGYVGKPWDDVEARIADNGEILVKSPGQMLGYYKQPELTAECMLPDGFFKTGDRGEMDEQGRLRITGRVKELFKTGKGKYVAPAPIENKLAEYPSLEAVCVTGSGFPNPFALLLLSADAHACASSDPGERQRLTQELESLRQHVNEGLEHHEQLAFMIIVSEPWTIESGFLTPTLKIRREVIEAHYMATAESWMQSQRTIIWE
jgi:long-subunit acyl-CoA synthetase (AMP-forming)